jgi:hypothetical protein
MHRLHVAAVSIADDPQQVEPVSPTGPAGVATTVE